jgi:hypothetical protein
MQTWGQNYWETHAPVVNWESVHLLFAIAKIHGLPSKSIDFVLAFLQANLEVHVLFTWNYQWVLTPFTMRVEQFMYFF